MYEILTINVTTEVKDNNLYLLVDGPTYGRRNDLHKLGFLYCESEKCWRTSFEFKVIDIIESWPEVRLTHKASIMIQRIREARRKRDAQHKAAAYRVITIQEVAHAA
jgi:hypothetical protein